MAEVDIMTFDEEEIAPEPVVPQPLRKSPKEKRKKKKKPATRESEGRFVIQLRMSGAAQPAEAVEEERRPGSTAKILSASTVHCVEDGVVLAAEAANVQEKGTREPVPATNELQPLIEGDRPVVEIVSAPTLGAADAVVGIAQGLPATERAEIPTIVEIHDSPVNGHQVDIIPVSQPSSPASTAAIAVTAGEGEEKKQIPSARKDAEEIMPMVEQAMVKVCEWSERIEA
jgi:hypothetical protein